MSTGSHIAVARTCTGCGLEKPADSFYKNDAYAGGLYSRCVECAQRETPRAVRMRENLLLRERGLKRCLHCDEVKDLSEFTPKSTPAGNPGLTAHCKECGRVKNRARFAADPTPWRENAAARYERLKETEEGREAIRRRGRIQASRRRALIREAFVEDVDPKVVFERDGGICGICDEAIEGAFDVDHVVPLAHGGEHSYGNVRATHVKCNRQRGRSVSMALLTI